MNRPTLIKRTFAKTKTFLAELNLFPTYEDDDFHETRNQILSTRIYLIVLILSVTGLFIYTSTVSITETIIIKQPLFRQYEKLITEKINPQCQCKQTSITFNQFLDIQPHYHSICSSDFVSDQWIDFLSNLTRLSNPTLSDFRRTAVYSFQFLRSLCELAEKTINETLQQQLQTKMYVSLHVKTEDVLQNEIESYINTMVSTEEMNFVQLFRIFSDMTYSQNLASTLSTNLHQLNNHDNASEFIRDWEVPGFSDGCYPFWGAIHSRLFCLYNESCLVELIEYVQGTFQMNISALKEHSSSSIFNSSTFIMDLVKELMVEQWDQNIIYEHYYEKCQPKQCIYTYVKQLHIGYMISIILGIIGGLSLSLRIAVPFVIKSIRKIWIKLRNKGDEDDQTNRCTQMKILLSKAIIFIQTFNLFKPPFEQPPSVPIFEHQKQLQRKLQIISTRIYIFLLFFFAATIIISTSLRKTAETKVFSVLSYSNYQNLLTNFTLNSLSCPCSLISSKYSNFLSIQAKSMHSVCSNRIFNPNWMGLPLGFELAPIEENSPFVLVFYLQFARSLCDYAKFLLGQQGKQFLSTFYTTSFLTTSEQFEKYFKLQINQFQQALSSYYKRLIKISRISISGNSLLSPAKTNYEWDLVNTTGAQIAFPSASRVIQLKTKPKVYNNVTYPCHIPSKFYKQHLYFPNSKIPIPGLYLSCYFIDGLLKSTLECFYNITCLQLLQNLMLSPINLVAFKMNFPLNSSLYRMNSTVEELSDLLFVDEWSHNISYQSYPDQCHPKECLYTFVTRSHFRYIITTLFSIMGGLAKVLTVLIPPSIKIYHRLWQYLRRKQNIRHLRINNRIKPAMPSLST
ncbi:hypothetical protein I4U23_011656 [Adineta vaga]|nr:hypothetical protein I4U23_011656 [Adineta vaga]